MVSISPLLDFGSHTSGSGMKRYSILRPEGEVSVLTADWSAAWARARANSNEQIKIFIFAKIFEHLELDTHLGKITRKKKWQTTYTVATVTTGD